jgi:hypothetical protein
MRWLHAGGDLAQPNSIHQCADRASPRSKTNRKCLSHSSHLACDHTCRWRRAGVLPISEIDANIKST